MLKIALTLPSPVSTPSLIIAVFAPTNSKEKDLKRQMIDTKKQVYQDFCRQKNKNKTSSKNMAKEFYSSLPRGSLPRVPFHITHSN